MSGFTSTTPTRLAVRGGDLYIDGAKFGTTDGGLSFDPGEERVDETFDGQGAPVSGMRRLIMRRPTFSGTLRELSADKLMTMIPGATQTTPSVGVTRITPPRTHDLIPTAEYPAAYIEWKLADGKRFRAIFAKADFGQWSVSSDAARANIPFRIDGLLDMDAVGATVEDAPYVLEIHPAA